MKFKKFKARRCLLLIILSVFIEYWAFTVPVPHANNSAINANMFFNAYGIL